MREMYPWLEKYSLSFLFDEIIEHSSFIAKRMFGGVAAYLHGRICAVIMQNPSDRIWNGLLIPSRKERHIELKKVYPSAEQHAILASWLYLSCELDSFEEEALKYMKALKNDNPLYGVEKTVKKKKRKISKERNLKKDKNVRLIRKNKLKAKQNSV